MDMTSRWKRTGIWLPFLLLAFACASPAACAGGEYRMLWVDVFHPGIRTPAEIDTMLQAARSANYNAVVVEVRKACDAYYNSKIEPKSISLVPTFDPLAYLIRRAHDTSGGNRRIEVHAWLVTYRCRMTNDETSRHPRHILQRHPDWISQKYDGSTEDTAEKGRIGWLYLDPGVPGVIDHTLEVTRDLVTNYDVDGVTFDYLRYPESKGGGNQWGYNPVAVARFNAIYGRSGRPAPDDPQFCQFRQRQIFFLMRKVYAHVRVWRPLVKVSAALIAWGDVAGGFEKSDAYSIVLQDWPSMARAGFLDIMLPMNYKRERVAREAADFRDWTLFLAATAKQTGRFGVDIISGQNMNALDDVLAQTQGARNVDGIAGVSTYAYSECRKGAPAIPDTAFFAAVRSRLFPSAISVPEATWLTRPSDGLLKGYVASGGRALDGASVRLNSGNTTITDGSGFYALARLRPGTYKMRVEFRGQALAEEEVQISAGKVAEKSVMR